MKWVTISVLVAIATAILPVCGQATEFDDIVKAAAKEGTMVMWASTPREDTTQALVDIFNKKFGVNIKIERVGVSAGDVASRMLAEKRGGRYTVDMTIVSDRTMPTLIQNDVVEKVDWVGVFGGKINGLEIAATDIVKLARGYGLQYRDLVYGIAYNSKVIPEDKAPKTWADLTDPKWKRKITIDSGLSPIARLTSTIGKEAVLQLGKEILQNQPIYADGTEAAVLKVVSGEAPIGVLALNTALGEKRKGAPIEMVHPLPLAMVSGQLMVVAKNAPHPNLAKLFTAWFAGEGMASKPNIDEGSLLARAGAPGEFGEYFTKHNLVTKRAETIEDLEADNDVRKDLVKLVAGK
jgi:ABC-type Fe3+ transport system substrate-binding protein